ncbi:MAG: glycosyltransferase family 2 protein [Bacilli bacterium]|nr:glycosyltransferase family 2 protein [Bacilli bacterium]
MKKEVLYIVVPCYNEEEVLHETNKRLLSKIDDLITKNIISNKSKIMYVNDGSKDKTWDIILELHNKNKKVTGVCLSRNRGHQNALLAGLFTAKKSADIVISMDADLQDDINAIDEMIQKYHDGSEIVYGVRSSRKKDTFFKRFTAQSFYKFMKLMGVDVIYNHADYRLTTKKVLDNLEKFNEVNLFLRGIFPIIGYKHDVVYYERSERFAGKSKYPLKKMLNFAWDGITSFSVKPIRLILSIGILTCILSFTTIVTLIVLDLIFLDLSKWVYIILSIWLSLGIQLFAIGIVGEYVGKTYIETKSRPRFIISRNLEEE